MHAIIFLPSVFYNIQNHLGTQWIELRNDACLQAIRFIKDAECGAAPDIRDLVRSLVCA